jgi:hypothetical protein
MEIRHKKILMIQAILPESEHQKLLSTFPAKHPKVYAHHMTIAFKPSKEICERYLPLVGDELNLPVITEFNDDKAQAVLIDTIYSENEFPHITVSTDNDTKPSYSNSLISNNIASLSLEGPSGLVLKGTVTFVLKNQSKITEPFELVD